MTNLCISALLLGSVLVGCGEAPDTGGGKELTLEIGGARLSIRVPAEAQIRSRAHPPGAVVVDFRPGRRQPQTITLWPAPAATKAKERMSRRLSSGARLIYVAGKSEGGSGGEEALLIGVLQFESLSLGVECHIQRELPPPDPTWCIPALDTLRMIKSG